MYALNFEYDNRYLSDYGFIVCEFDYSSGAVTANAGSNITFNKVSQHNGRRFNLTSAVYSECITSSFDICKNPDLYSRNDMVITNEEYRNLSLWLNRKKFLKFRLIDDSNSDYVNETCYYNASFNIEKIKIGDVLYGLRLSMETDSPFAHGKDIKVNLKFTAENETKTIQCISDEIGYLYPDLTIICKQNGDISISNTTQECNMIVKNCRAGEVINIFGESQIIMSSLDEHDICNDFNYEFFKIGRTFSNIDNKITVSSPCDISIKYTPIIKDSP